MKPFLFGKYSIILWLSLFHCHLFAQQVSTIREYQKPLKTYPFSDPNPVANVAKIYPYFRYDGFTEQAVTRNWKIVEMENDFIRLQIMPELGGKVWSAVEKKNGKPFIYENHVVKFRDIAMRGPWTSGGIEFNYGTVGHTPNCAAPVDYRLCNNPDGSVSCFISTPELLTDTRWVIEINLPKDKAWFTTRSFWYNGTPEDEPYYTWTNLGVKATTDLKFIYPGTHLIRHDGVAFPWPADTARGKDLSEWAQNNFIGSKSYHIIGAHRNYFGTYWKDQDFGMLRYSSKDDKLGKKLFSWALSDQGKIWTELLTDTDGQYVELQSGRLFNQNMVESSLTPFKQTGFTPYGSDSWTEYWFPYQGTGGVTSANLNGVLHISRTANSLDLVISPLQQITDTLFLLNTAGDTIYRTGVQLSPLKVWHHHISLKKEMDPTSLYLNGLKWELKTETDVLERPVDPPGDFDWSSAYGQYLSGRDLIWMRNYADAETHIRKSLAKDGNFIPALSAMAHLQYRKMKYDSAFYFAKKALSIDTYDAHANYYYGLTAAKLGKWYDALDGFEVSALSSDLRSASYTEMSKLYLIKKDYKNAQVYAQKSLINNQQNVEGLKLCFLSARLQNKNHVHEKEQLLKLDPLNHFVEFEQYWLEKTVASRTAFTAHIKHERPQETYLQMAIWYHNLNRNAESKALLTLSPQTSEILFWRAYLEQKEPNGKQLLKKALQSNPYLVFPFREESAIVMNWAAAQTTSWLPKYYSALIQQFRNNKTEAFNWLAEVKDDVPYAPFYILRASLTDSNDATGIERDLQQAIKTDPASWRYHQYLSRFYLIKKNYTKALNAIEPYYQSHPANYLIGIQYIRCLMRNNKYANANKILDRIHILPFEGAIDGRRLYEETKLMLALENMKAGKYQEALTYIEAAYKWPHTLGVGKPYEEVIDSRAEDWMSSLSFYALKDRKQGDRYLEKVANANQDKAAVNTLLQCLALSRLGEDTKSEQLFKEWTGLQKNEEIRKWGNEFYQENKDKKPAQGIDAKAYSGLLGSISSQEDQRLF